MITIAFFVGFAGGALAGALVVYTLPSWRKAWRLRRHVGMYCDPRVGLAMQRRMNEKNPYWRTMQIGKYMRLRSGAKPMATVKRRESSV